MNKVIALVGLPGSGKTEAANVLLEKGFYVVRFGDITDVELKKRALERNEKNERFVREALRKEHGMEAYAKLNIPLIDKALKKSNVVCDGMRSWEEYLVMKEHYKDKLTIVAVYASPKTRYLRLGERKERPLTEKECISRDKSEIENLHTAGSISMADFTIINEGNKEELKNKVNALL